MVKEDHVRPKRVNRSREGPFHPRLAYRQQDLGLGRMVRDAKEDEVREAECRQLSWERRGISGVKQGDAMAGSQELADLGDSDGLRPHRRLGHEVMQGDEDAQRHHLQTSGAGG